MWVQEMKKEAKGLTVFLYFLLVIFFHGAIIFTDIGNYFHGGGPVGWVLLQVSAVLISLMAVKLLGVMGVVGKILVSLGGMFPAIFLFGSILFFLRECMG
ncbi:hypothetical protein CJO94_06380 [Ralstonia solanacearum]|nr:hypothetical protein CJO94_06380 [Ralstonia solanacearum]